jgi:5-methylcytosine-specific restriction endonuclease McrA
MYNLGTFVARYKMSFNKEKVLVEETLLKEGWTILTEYTGIHTPFIASHPDYYKGHPLKVIWNNWKRRNSRPNFYGLVDKTAYVKELMNLEGWELKSEVISSHQHLYISNPNKFKGHLCITSWQVWQRGSRPDFQSLANKKEFLSDFLVEYGFELDPQTPEKVKGKEYFKVFKNNRSYTTCWAALTSGLIPDSMRVIVRHRVKAFLKSKKKTCRMCDIFSENYYRRLNTKFPIFKKDHHLDHIIPLSYFGDSKKQIRLAYHLKNLRLVPKEQNLERNNKLTKEDLELNNLNWLFSVAENPKNYPVV